MIGLYDIVKWSDQELAQKIGDLARNWRVLNTEQAGHGGHWNLIDLESR